MKHFITKYCKYLAYIFSVFFILVIWTILSNKVNSRLILPGPGSVFIEVVNIIKTIQFWKNFSVSFLRIISAYFITVVIGLFVGYLCGTYKFINYFFEIPLGILRTTPVIAVILIALFWFNSNFVPIFVCILMTLPIMITSVSKGFSSTIESEKLLEMSNIFHFSKIQIFLYVKLPYALNNIKSGLLSTFGLSWKVVVAGEVLCLPIYAIGSDLHKAQVHLETVSIMAETIILIFICFILEKIFEMLLSINVNDKTRNKNV